MAAPIPSIRLRPQNIGRAQIRYFGIFLHLIVLDGQEGDNPVIVVYQMHFFYAAIVNVPPQTQVWDHVIDGSPATITLAAVPYDYSTRNRNFVLVLWSRMSQRKWDHMHPWESPYQQSTKRVFTVIIF